MDFTYILAFGIGAVLSLVLSIIALVVRFVAKRRIPYRYRTYVVAFVAIFVAAVSLRWTDWRAILFTTFGLVDLAIVLAFATFGAFVGMFPLWFIRQKRSPL